MGRLSRADLIPRLAFVFLHAANQPRFEFTRSGNRTIDGVKTREVRFKEVARPTIIRASDGKDAPSEGSFWIDPATGEVLMSRIRNADSSSLSLVQTLTFRRDEATGLRLPASMEEKVVDDDDAIRVEGTSTFSKWRIVPRKG